MTDVEQATSTLSVTAHGLLNRAAAIKLAAALLGSKMRSPEETAELVGIIEAETTLLIDTLLNVARGLPA